MKNIIAGVDEVGRGAIAGPVIAAAVILKKDIEGLKDSKKINTDDIFSLILNKGKIRAKKISN